MTMLGNIVEVSDRDMAILACIGAYALVVYILLVAHGLANKEKMKYRDEFCYFASIFWPLTFLVFFIAFIMVVWTICVPDWFKHGIAKACFIASLPFRPVTLGRMIAKLFTAKNTRWRK